MEYRLLGPLEVWHGGRTVPVGGGKRRSLLALLLLHPNEVVSAERLIHELWGEHPPATSAKILQIHVSQLRRELHVGPPGANGEALATRAGGYVLELQPDDLDVEQFEQLLADGVRALAAGQPARAAERLGQGLGLWRGPPLADFTYEPFAQQEIARLHELRLHALEQRIEADLALGRDAGLVGELDALVREHPLRERLRGLLMLALYRSGRRAEALEAFQDVRRQMVDELGLEPGPELRDLQAAILADRPELMPPRSGEPEPADGALAPAATAPPKRVRAPPRAAVIMLAGAVLLGAAVGAALRRDDAGDAAERRVALDLAVNSIAAVDVAARGPSFGLPLSGRPTDIAATPDGVVAVTVNSASLTAVDHRSRSIARTVPLAAAPGAVAADAGGAWVADAARGRLVRYRAGYERPVAIVSWARKRKGSTAVALGAGAVWTTDGSRTLRRVDPRTRAVTAIRVPAALDGVTFGAGAVWAYGSRAATVFRIDPAGGSITDEVEVVSRTGSTAPAPVGIAATQRSVWLLNANTATVTRIDASQRGVADTVTIGVDRVPRDIAAADETVWVANADGSLTRIAAATGAVSTVWIGESLDAVAAAGRRVWVTTTALDRRLPGGSE